MTRPSTQQWTLRDEGLALRLRIRLNMIKSGMIPEPQKRLAFLIRGWRWNVFMAVLLAAAAFSVYRGIWVAVGMLVPMPVLFWLEHRATQARWNDLLRAQRWRQIAFAIGLHLKHEDTDDPGMAGHNMRVAHAVVKNVDKTIDQDEIMRVLQIASLTTHRNRMLIGAYLQLMLLSRAEEIRFSVLNGSDDPDLTMEDLLDNLDAVRRMPRSGLLPITGLPEDRPTPKTAEDVRRTTS